MEELKPCPLCLSDYIQIWFEEVGIPHKRLPIIVCNACSLMLKGEHFVHELNTTTAYTFELIKKWNRRNEEV